MLMTKVQPANEHSDFVSNVDKINFMSFEVAKCTPGMI